MIAELKATSPASLRAVFCLGQRRQIRIELDIDLIGGNDRSENRWAEIAMIMDGIIDSDRYYQRLDPACKEGDWHQLRDLIRRCHERVRLAPGQLSTSISIADGRDAIRKLQTGGKLSGPAAAVAIAMLDRQWLSINENTQNDGAIQDDPAYAG